MDKFELTTAQQQRIDRALERLSGPTGPARQRRVRGLANVLWECGAGYPRTQRQQIARQILSGLRADVLDDDMRWLVNNELPSGL